jgi:Xaa-Pro aminopeptidase
MTGKNRGRSAGVSNTSFSSRRRRLGQNLPDGLVVLASAPEILRNGDAHYPFRQSSDFLYLTGVAEPGCVLVLDPARGTETLLVPRLTQQHAVWLGHIPSPGEARERYAIRSVQYTDALPALLKARAPRLVHVDAHARRLVRRLRPRARLRGRELREALDELRLIKDTAELALLRKANRITEAGHRAAMRCARAGLHEFQVQAELERGFLAAGATGLGYASIVAAGRNGAVLHYHANDARLSRGDLLLIDAGAEYQGYTADVTRTFPVGGRFAPAQRDLYDVVLTAQQACIGFARAGNTTMDLQCLAERTLAEGLRGLGLLRGGLDELVDTEAVRVFFPHGIGHTLGLDVHDTQGSPRRRLHRTGSARIRFRARLQAGFVFTIEPGVYFIDALLDDRSLRRRHRGRVDFERAARFRPLGGIRIEDDVVVRPSGPPENLTRVPREIRAIEEACAA